MLPLAALGLLCGQLPAVLAQAAPVRGGYVHITPSSATIAQGGTLQLRSAVLTPLGFQLQNRTVTWKSSNAAIAGVSNTGLITAVAPGAVTITAKSGAALGTATVNVSGAPPNTAPVVTITAPADGATFQVTTPITFTGAATDLQEGNLSNGIVWSAASAADPNGTPTQLGTGASVVTGSLVAGSYLVTASATDSGHLTGIAQVGITVEPPCSIHWDLQPPTGIKIPQELQLDATGSYDTCGRPLQYIWWCQSDISTRCPSFLLQANGVAQQGQVLPGYNNATPVLDLPPLDSISIGLQLCVLGTNECTPQPFSDQGNFLDDHFINFYEGAPVGP